MKCKLKIPVAFTSLILCSFLLPSCGNSEAQAEQESEVSAREIISENRIKIGSISKRSLEKSISLMGAVEAPPQSQASVYPAMGAFVEKVFVIRGSKVEKGQKLASLRHPEISSLQQAYLGAKSRMEQSRAHYLRQQKLSEKQATASSTLEQAKAEFLSAQSEAKRLAGNLMAIGIEADKLSEDTLVEVVFLRAPIGGHIQENVAQVGRLASAGEALFTIVSKNHLHLELSVPPSKIALVKSGQKLRFEAASGAKKYEGEVYLVNQVADENGFFNVHAHFDDAEHQLLPGTFVKAQLIYEQDSLMALPQTAVAKREGQYFALLVEGEKLHPVKITPGMQSDSLMAVINHKDLQGKQLVLNRAQYLMAQTQGGHSH